MILGIVLCTLVLSVCFFRLYQLSRVEEEEEHKVWEYGPLFPIQNHSIIVEATKSKEKKKMKITEFRNEVSRDQKGGKGNKVNVADIGELLRTIRRKIKEGTGVDIYTIIRRM